MPWTLLETHAMPRHVLLLPLLAVVAACSSATPPADVPTPATTTPAGAPESSYAERQLATYATVRLQADLSHLSDNQRRMVALLVEAGRTMDPVFWQQVWGERDALMAQLPDEASRRFADINYGPWDRLNNDRPFVQDVGPRPPGARFYPGYMSAEEFEAADLAGKRDLYTLLRRNDQGALVTIPYSVAFGDALQQTAKLLREAAALAEDAGFRRYLELRAAALLDDNYQPSDLAWMDMKTNTVDVVIGPIETYQDTLFGYKAAFSAYVLIKDVAWSQRLERFAAYLPELQRELPVGPRYKAESPGSDADLNAYFAVYYAGDSNSGAKTIAINLPNDEEVQLAKGSRRLQLQNVMQAKFDTIMQPIAAELIAEEQLANVRFEAFFENVMFHEVAHGLGIKNTINDRGTVREALRELASPFEEAKADILGLYMIGKLADRGELDAARLSDNYVTFLAGIFRSVRFGASSAHGQANMLTFNFLQQAGAFSRDEGSGRYRVDIDAMRKGVDALSEKILTLQGDGDLDGARASLAEFGSIGMSLASDLERLAAAGIPVDIVFEQGLDVLGLAAP
jgi:hypothetical protein